MKCEIQEDAADEANMTRRCHVSHDNICKSSVFDVRIFGNSR